MLDTYRSRELATRFSAWRGLALTRGGARLELGYFGGGAEEIFAGSPEALDEMRTFRTLRVTGVTLYALGLAMMLTDLALIASDSNLVVEKSSDGKREAKPLMWILLFPGAAAGLTGAFMMQGANGSLSDAVELYNRDLAHQLQGRSRLMLRVGGAF